MKHLPWLLCVLLVVDTVSAQETSAPSAPAQAKSAPEPALASLVIEVRAQRVSRSELSQALLKELSQDPNRAEGETPKGALELSDSASNTIRLSYRDALGRVTTRDLFLAPDDPEALEKITIAAANLVRDQTGALSQLEAAQRAEEEAALKALENQPAPTPAPKPAEPAKPIYDPCHPPLAIPFGIDLAWMLGTSSTPVGQQAARGLSIGFLGTYSGGVHGAQFSLLANVDRRGMCGFEAAVGLNLNLGDGKGVQLALSNATIGHLRGVQLGLANFAGKGVYGVQLGIANVAFDATSVQLAVANIATGNTRAQLGVANYTHGSSGLQLGVANVTWGRARGQLSVVNIAKDRVTTQLGVINYAGSARAPLGLISIVKDGHTGVDAWANENGALFGMLTHGGDRVYNMYGVGTRIQKGGSRLALALGIAARLFQGERFALDLQLLHEMYPRLNPWRNHAQVERLRLAAEIKIIDRISLVPAVGYALMLSEYEGEPVQAPFGETVFRPPHIDSDGKRHMGVTGYPSFGLGVRLMLSNPKKPR